MSTILSVIAIVISLTTMWLTLLRKGNIKMTQPTVIFFGPDGGTQNHSKVFFRTLLFSTAKRGLVIENMYIRLKRKESQQNFNIWVYGDSGSLNRGSGLHIGETGISTNHHFLSPADAKNYDFKSGEYSLEVYIHLLGDNKDKLLYRTTLLISDLEAHQLRQGDCGIYFDWGTDSKQYHSYIDKKPDARLRGHDTARIT